ncbi:MAG: hypothetical protein ACLPSM_12760, partial [Acidimicrobiales bacterium]
RAPPQLTRQPVASRIREKEDGPGPYENSSGIINLSVEAGQFHSLFQPDPVVHAPYWVVT